MKKIVALLKVFAVALSFLPLVVAVAPQTAVAATFTNSICQPAGTNSITQCVNNVYIVAVAAAGFGGVVLFAYAGYLWMIGTSEFVSRAKKIMTSVIVGMLILFGTYAILNTINPNLTNLALSIPIVTCTSATCPAAANVPGPAPAPVTAPPVTSAGVSCLFTNQNYCQGSATDALGNPNQCGAPICAQYVPAIQAVAVQVGGSATVAVLKAIIFKESACQISAGNGGGGAFGLMQLQAAAAANPTFDAACGVNSSSVNQAWLVDPANAQASICIGAEYLNSLAPICGSGTADLMAGYSGGAAACAPSVDCTQQVGCDGTPMHRWECLYDDTAHQTCNGNNTVIGPAAEYNETRNAVMTKLYCVANPGF